MTHTVNMKHLSIVVGLLGIVSSAWSQDRWSLTTADFNRQQVALRAIDERGVVADERLTTLERFLMVERAGAAAEPKGTFTLYLLNGDRITGEATGVKGETLIWNSSAIGEMSFKLRDVAGFARGQATVNIDANRSNDLVTLQNLDIVKGIFSTIKDNTLIIRVDGADVSLPMTAVTSISLAVTGASKASTERSFRIRTSDGSSIVAPSVKTDGDKLVLTLADKTSRPLPLAAVVSIEQLNGPVAWLSTLAPTINEQTPFMGQTWPARMDTTVTGSPIKAGDRIITRGIGVHARSKIAYALDGGYAAFRTQYAIDGNGVYADVDVRILLDDKVIHEHKSLKAGVVVPVLMIPLAGAKMLTLEVDYGKTHDVQDRFNWIEPALLRKLPAEAAPATGPATMPTEIP